MKETGKKVNQAELSKEAIRNIELARERIKQGKFLSEDDARKKLNL